MMHGLIMSETDLKALAVEISNTIESRIAGLLSKSQVESAVSREEMAELLGVGVATIDRLVRDNAIPSMLPGTRRLFLPSKVYEALSMRR
jgi:excisionase family DNA binding protein